MPDPRIAVGAPREADTPAVLDLIAAQERRWRTHQPLIAPPRDQETIAAQLSAHRRDPAYRPLVARDSAGRVRGYAQPACYALPAESDLRAYFKERNGTVAALALPPPEGATATTVLATLLGALDAQWRRDRCQTDLVTWPSGDGAVETMLGAAGFQPAYVSTYRPMTPLPMSISTHTTVGIRVRRASAADTETLVELNRANFANDAANSPFIEVVPTVDLTFRAELARLWTGASVEEGAPLILVAEEEGVIVGMARTYLETVTNVGDIGQLASGRYGYLSQVFVRPEVRGKGVGRALTQAALEVYGAFDVAGLTLTLSTGNPLARTFWPHLGFVPIWTWHMRLAPGTASASDSAKNALAKAQCTNTG